MTQPARTMPWLSLLEQCYDSTCRSNAMSQQCLPETKSQNNAMTLSMKSSEIWSQVLAACLIHQSWNDKTQIWPSITGGWQNPNLTINYWWMTKPKSDHQLLVDDKTQIWPSITGGWQNPNLTINYWWIPQPENDMAKWHELLTLPDALNSGTTTDCSTDFTLSIDKSCNDRSHKCHHSRHKTTTIKQHTNTMTYSYKCRS